MINLSAEKIFYNYIRLQPDLYDFVKPDFFSHIGIQEAYRIDVQFHKQFNQIPSIKQVTELIRQQNIKYFITEQDGETFVDKSKIDSLFESVKEYENGWMDENVHAWVQYKNLDSSLFNAVSYLKSTNITAENIKDVVEKIKSIIQDQNNIDFSFSEGLDFFNPDAHKIEKTDTFTTGYSWYDSLINGGWQPKTLHVTAGPLKGGKCVTSDAKIKIRNKTTKIVEEIPIGEFYDRLRNEIK